MRGPGQATLPASWRLRWLLVVVVAMTVLAAGWPLVSASISSTQPLAAGRTLTIGPDSRHIAHFTIGPGWSLVTSQSNPQQNYRLSRAGAILTVSYVTLTSSPAAAKLWSGLRSIVRIGDASARLSASRPVRNSQGIKGRTGTQALSRGRTGIAAIFPAPGGKFAIEITAAAEPGAAAAHLAARRVARSISFPAVRR
jgi:hypothetical protein